MHRLTRFADLLNAPYGFAAGDTNLMRYVGNRPTNRVDPSGLADKDELTGKSKQHRIGDFDEVLEEIFKKIDASGDSKLPDNVNRNRLALSVGAAFAGHLSTTEDRQFLKNRYLFTARAGVVDLQHFFQAWIAAVMLDDERAVGLGVHWELKNNDPNTYFMPDDITSNALGAWFGSRLPSAGLLKIGPTKDELKKAFKKEMALLCPIDWSKMSAKEQEMVVQFYASDGDGAKNASKKIVTDIDKKLTLKIESCKPWADLGFPYIVGSTWITTPNGDPMSKNPLDYIVGVSATQKQWDDTRILGRIGDTPSDPKYYVLQIELRKKIYKHY
jgi:hypothetical protein